MGLKQPNNVVMYEALYAHKLFSKGAFGWSAWWICAINLNKQKLHRELFSLHMKLLITQIPIEIQIIQIKSQII